MWDVNSCFNFYYGSIDVSSLTPSNLHRYLSLNFCQSFLLSQSGHGLLGAQEKQALYACVRGFVTAFLCVRSGAPYTVIRSNEHRRSYQVTFVCNSSFHSTVLSSPVADKA